MPRLASPRLAPLSDDEMDADTRALLGAGAIGVRPRPRPQHLPHARAPPEAAEALAGVRQPRARPNSTLPPRERELVILRIGWLCRSDYEWGQHVAIASAQRASRTEIDRIRRAPTRRAGATSTRDPARAPTSCTPTHFLSDATWQGALRALDTQQLVDFIFTVGQYTLVSMALNCFGVQLDAGREGLRWLTASPSALLYHSICN